MTALNIICIWIIISFILAPLIAKLFFAINQSKAKQDQPALPHQPEYPDYKEETTSSL